MAQKRGLGALAVFFVAAGLSGFAFLYWQLLDACRRLGGKLDLATLSCDMGLGPHDVYYFVFSGREFLVPGVVGLLCGSLVLFGYSRLARRNNR